MCFASGNIDFIQKKKSKSEVCFKNSSRLKSKKLKQQHYFGNSIPSKSLYQRRKQKENSNDSDSKEKTYHNFSSNVTETRRVTDVDICFVCRFISVGNFECQVDMFFSCKTWIEFKARNERNLSMRKKMSTRRKMKKIMTQHHLDKSLTQIQD